MCGPFDLQMPYALVATTVVLAVTFCSVGLFLGFVYQGTQQRVASAVIIGGAVFCVHNVVCCCGDCCVVLRFFHFNVRDIKS